MNSAEKKVVYMAVAFLVVGVVVRFLPWGIPSIEQDDDLLARESVPAQVHQVPPESTDNPQITNKVISSDDDEEVAPQKKKKRKRSGCRLPGRGTC